MVIWYGSFYKITYELFDVGDDADKGHLLLLDSLCYQIVLKEMRVIDI